MLFFPAEKNSDQKRKQKNRTSPVRNSRSILNGWSREKRALLPASARGGRARRVRGSLTIEAALVLPLFLFAGLCLAMPVRLLDEQRKIQGTLERTGEELSQYAYAAWQLQEHTGLGQLEENTEDLLTTAYAAAQVLSRIDTENLEGISFAKTSIMEDNEIYLVMDYRMRLPFSFLGLESIPAEAVSCRRAWVGAEESRRKSETGQGDSEEDPIVYVGRDSTRYHLDPHCHYLYNALESVSAQAVEGLRNQDGKKYSPCQRCGAAGAGATVYVFPSGTSWHTSKNCSAITAYVKAVHRSEVAYLGACSYCGR